MGLDGGRAGGEGLDVGGEFVGLLHMAVAVAPVGTYEHGIVYFGRGEICEVLLHLIDVGGYIAGRNGGNASYGNLHVGIEHVEGGAVVVEHSDEGVGLVALGP